jgi:S-adenosylmethionine:diacylglycerol 3-amino-3-carboxypropyl transferase
MLLLLLQIKKYEHEQKAVQDFKAREAAMVRGLLHTPAERLSDAFIMMPVPVHVQIAVALMIEESCSRSADKDAPVLAAAAAAVTRLSGRLSRSVRPRWPS